MRAVIYARYSSEHQREASIEDQLRLCKEFIARQGWRLHQVFRDAAMSGSPSLRPGYQARRAECEVVVVEALDSLSRARSRGRCRVLQALSVRRREHRDPGRG